jgi:acetyl-CoA C-acetyltransferase
MSVYIVDGRRTPFLKAKEPGPFFASDLLVETGASLLNTVGLEVDALDEVIVGCAMPTPREANIARIVALRLGAGNSVPGYTVHRNCASGLQAIDNAYQSILLGKNELVLAGGGEAMSHAPLLFNEDMVRFLVKLAGAKTFLQKLAVFASFRPHYLKPVVALLLGLTDPVVSLSMGQTAENVAYRFGITREMMDAFSMQSHQRSIEALKTGVFDNEIIPLFDKKGSLYNTDTGVRTDASLERLAKLKPFFDKKFGAVTAGNSSQVTDGAALTLLASEKAVRRYNLPVIARICDIQFAACDPAYMGLGPVYATTPMLKRYGLSLNDIDYWETNEAFAAQVLGCLAAWKDKAFCQRELGLEDAFGEIDPAKLNIDGGAIALGHPIGASGARIALHLAKTLERKGGRYGVANICIGGGQGGALLIERTNELSR